MSKRLSFAVALVVIAMLAVACGGGGGSENTTSSSTASSSGEVQSIEVSLTDFRFNPNAITVQKGQTVEITLKNDGRVAHDFKIDALGVESEVISPGQSATVTFTPDSAGEFEIICTEPGHEASGMTGTLVVE